MKCSAQFVKIICITIIWGSLAFACRKNPASPPDPGTPGPVTPGTSLNSDSISNHLLFINATKKQGAVPQGGSGTNLKISFEDTLYLTDKVKRPIKFLHVDTTKDVKGVYIQVHASIAGTNASYYYDVPEVPDMADSDTVSVVLLGADPAGLLGPAGSPGLIFQVTIVAYDQSGQALDQATRPAKIDHPKSNAATGTCGLQLPPGDFWNWDLSLIEDPINGKLFFYNDADKIWGGAGQLITGCCINGNSSYNTVLDCDKDPTKARRKHFATFFQHQESATKFFNTGEYTQFSKQIHSNPDPSASNFCSAQPGVVNVRSTDVTEEGTWTITKMTPYKGDSLYLRLFQTKSTGVGLVSPEGFIHQLDCSVLVLINPDNEGQDRDLVSFYTRINTSISGWYDML